MDIFHSCSSSMKFLDLHMTGMLFLLMMLLGGFLSLFLWAVWEVPSAVWLDLHALGSWYLTSTFSIICPRPDTIFECSAMLESPCQKLLSQGNTQMQIQTSNHKNNYFWKVSLAQLQMSLISVHMYIGQQERETSYYGTILYIQRAATEVIMLAHFIWLQGIKTTRLQHKYMYLWQVVLVLMGSWMMWEKQIQLVLFWF